MTDDTRFAELRARSLAERGAGDAFIRHELRSGGVDDESIEAALGDLEPEIVRAERIVERRGRSPRTARFLAAKGFSEDVVYAAVARDGDEPLG